MGPNTRILSRPVNTIEIRVVHNYLKAPSNPKTIFVVLTTHHFAWSIDIRVAVSLVITDGTWNTYSVSYLRNTICNYGIMTNGCNLSDINETVST